MKKKPRGRQTRAVVSIPEANLDLIPIDYGMFHQRVLTDAVEACDHQAIVLV